MDASFARDLLLLAVAAVVVALVFNRFRLPTVAGLLVAGALMGPHGLGFASRTEDLEVFAEIGVVLLLFTIGLEFSLARLTRIGRTAVVSGILQIGATVGVVALIAKFSGEPLHRAIFFGMVAALSSTAIVLRSLEERDELDAPHGRLILSTLITQDLAIVPMILLLPLLAGGEGGQAWPKLALVLLKAAALTGVAVAFSRYVLPQLLRLVDAARSRELFVIAIVSLCAGMTWLGSAIGLSLALGAFLAGIMLADSEFAHRALTEVLPVRDVLISLFFVAIGMLFDLRVLLSAPAAVLLLLLLLLLGKGTIAALSVLVLRLPVRVALLFGLGLAQFGEFGYLLLKSGAKTVPPLVSPQELPVLLCAGVLSMFATPLIIRLAPHLAAGDKLFEPLERMLGARSLSDQPAGQPRLTGHIVMAGYGHAGQSVAAVLNANAVPYVVLELNSETVRTAQANGEPVYYADVTSGQALKKARLEQARALIVLINDQQAVERAIAAARAANPALPVLARTRYASQVANLYALGATAVVVDELESANQMVQMVCAMMCETDGQQNV